MNTKSRVAFLFVFSLLVTSSIQQAHSSEFVPLTVTSSQKWNGKVGDSNSLGKTIIFARNDSNFVLGNIQAVISYYDSFGKLIKSRNTYGAMLTRVAPGESVGIFDIFTDQPTTFSVSLVAGIPTDVPVNRNIRVDSVTWTAPDTQGYKYLKVQVTNLNKSVAQGVRFMANCGNFGGPYGFDGPTFPDSMEPGSTMTLYKQYAPGSPPCPNFPKVIAEAISAPSLETYPTDYDKAASELKAKQEAEAKVAAELKAKQEAEAKVAAELKAKEEAEAKAAADQIAKQEASAKAAAAKKTNITCFKGKLTKKVTGKNPKCPVGYRIKK